MCGCTIETRAGARKNRDVVKDYTENLSSTGVSGGESLLRGDAKE